MSAQIRTAAGNCKTPITGSTPVAASNILQGQRKPQDPIGQPAWRFRAVQTGKGRAPERIGARPRLSTTKMAN